MICCDDLQLCTDLSQVSTCRVLRSKNVAPALRSKPASTLAG